PEAWIAAFAVGSAFDEPSRDGQPACEDLRVYLLHAFGQWVWHGVAAVGTSVQTPQPDIGRRCRRGQRRRALRVDDVLPTGVAQDQAHAPATPIAACLRGNDPSCASGRL